MCRAGRSAHGRTSTALNAEAFPHDSADPPQTGPDRMCNTARAAPMPHIRARRPRPDTADPHPPHTRPHAPSHHSRPTPGSLRRERLIARTISSAEWGEDPLARADRFAEVEPVTRPPDSPRGRTSSRRSRGLSDVLAGYLAILQAAASDAPTLRCRDVHFALESAVQTTVFECKVHVSARKARRGPDSS